MEESKEIPQTFDYWLDLRSIGLGMAKIKPEWVKVLSRDGSLDSSGVSGSPSTSNSSMLSDYQGFLSKSPPQQLTEEEETRRIFLKSLVPNNANEKAQSLEDDEDFKRLLMEQVEHISDMDFEFDALLNFIDPTPFERPLEPLQRNDVPVEQLEVTSPRIVPPPAKRFAYTKKLNSKSQKKPRNLSSPHLNENEVEIISNQEILVSNPTIATIRLENDDGSGNPKSPMIQNDLHENYNPPTTRILKEKRVDAQRAISESGSQPMKPRRPSKRKSELGLQKLECESWETAPTEILQIGRSESCSDPDAYQVETVLDLKFFDNQRWFLTKWLGWSAQYNSWISEKSFEEDGDDVGSFLKKVSETAKEQNNCAFLHMKTSENAASMYAYFN